MLAAALPLVVLAAAIAVSSLRHRQEAIEREALGHVERISILLERELATQLQIISTLSSAPLLDDQVDETAFIEFARRIRRERPLWMAVVLSDPEGNRLIDIPEPVTGVAGGRVVDGKSHTRAVETRQPVIGGILRGPRDRPAFAVRAPVVRDDVVRYVVSAVIEPTAVRDLLFSGGVPANWMGAVIDAEERIVARRVGASSLIGELASDSARAAVARAPNGMYEGANREGSAAVIAYRVLPTANWSIHVAIPRDVYLAPVTHSFWLMAGGATLSLALAAAFVSLLLREFRLNRRDDAALAEGQRLEALGRMTGGVAHDFNNLLMIVQGGAEALKRRHSDPERVIKFADAILSAAERGKVITNQLLAFGRRNSHQPISFDLRTRAADLLPLLKSSTRGDIKVRFSVPNDSWPIHADPNALEVALINLAINARDAMPDGGQLLIISRNTILQDRSDESTGLRGAFVAIEVKDSGIGIPEEQLGKVFEPFFTTKPTGQGTGLGLSQVYGFAKQSGGAVVVTSQLGKGSTFTLYLPRAAEAPSKMPTPEVKDQESDGCRVLLVEDIPEVAQVTQAMLIGAGYTVHWVDSPGAALKAIQDPAPFGAVLSDIVMPGGISGIELAERVRERWPCMAIVLMTGYSEALALGSARGLHVVSKPFREAEVVAALKAARRASPELAQPSNVVRLTR